ncbi:ribonuclease H-like domain-containing protein, partial [Tanacetum coccineum]
MYSFFANQSSGPQLDHEDLEQLDEFDLEEMDLKWQVVMISMRLKKFYKKTGKRMQFDTKEPVGFDKTKVECFNCHKTGHFARECRSKGNQESRRRDARKHDIKAKDNGRRPRKQEEPKALVTLDGEGVDWTGHAEDEQENFALMAYKRQYQAQNEKILAEAVKKRSIKTKLENFQSSSKGLSKLLISQMSTRDKSGLGHACSSPPMTGNYMPLGPDRKVDDSIAETLESVHEPVVVEPKVVSQPKVWYDAPIIEEYESDNDDEYVIQSSKEQKKPSFAFVNTGKHVKTPRETVKEQNTYSPNPKANKRDWNGLMSKRLGLGYGFTKKACFVCGSFSHLIKDYDFPEKIMAKQVELNKKK